MLVKEFRRYGRAGTLGSAAWPWVYLRWPASARPTRLVQIELRWPSEALKRLKGMDLEAKPWRQGSGVESARLDSWDTSIRRVGQGVRIKGQSPALLEFAMQHPEQSVGVDALRLVLANGDSELVKSRFARRACGQPGTGFGQHG